MHTCYVTYQWINKKNEKKYIGKFTTRTRTKKLTEKLIKQRIITRYKQETKKPTRPINFAHIKYGFENFTLNIVGKAKTQAESIELEKLGIDIYDTLVPKGYNIKYGQGPESYKCGYLKRSVYAIEPNTYKIFLEFESSGEAADLLGVAKQTIEAAITHHHNQYLCGPKGSKKKDKFLWCYKEDYDKGNYTFLR